MPSPIIPNASWPILRHPLWMFVALLLISGESYRLWSHGLISTTETGLLEVGQNIFLFLACLLHSYHSRNDNAEPLYRYLCVGLALLCLALLLRELDIDKMGDNNQWRNIELLVRSVTVTGIIIFCGKLLRHPAITWSSLRSLSTMPILTFSFWGVCCYLCGWPFDKLLFAIPQGLSAWVEETLELNATILLFCAACTKPFHTKLIAAESCSQ
ncbi:MAG TPA: hypothetical protein VLE50_00675 [Cellvibrio sp.]|nr:hypothetical protein [Cellvibrio sp.]